MAHESAGDSEELDFLELQRQHIIESIPEFSAFENQKENVLPRRKGRSAAELVSFAVDNEKRQEELQQGHEKFENELQQLDELDDPLEVYVRYIDWTEEMYPQGHNQESDLFELVREATTRFQNSEQYKNDVRYLRCWMKYADMLKEPGEVFQLVSKYKIGQMLAMYYEKYAAYLERNGRLSDAVKVLSAGINRKAQPLARLERSYRLFQSRLENSNRQSSPVNAALAQMRALERTGKRSILGEKLDSQEPVSVPSNVYNRMHPNASSSHNSRTGFGNGSTSSSTQPSSSRFAVYVDPSSSSSSSSSSISSLLPSFSTTSTTSSSLSSAESSTSRAQTSIISDARHRAENAPSVSKFAGTTIPQRPYKRPDPPKFQVYRDDDPQDDTTTNSTSSTNRMEDMTMTMTLNGRSLGGSRPVSNAAKLTDRFRRSRAKLIRSADSSGREEYISACASCIKDNQEISFEELRTMRRDVSLLAAMEGIPLSESKAFIEQEKERHRKEQNRKQKQKQSAEELTAETRAAMESIDAMLAKRRVDETPQDEDEAIPWGRVPKQRKLVNENAPSSSSMSQMQQQDSFFSDDMGFRGGDEDDDDDEMERDMAREAEEARKRVG
ncbi:hypothetical protein VTP01DRAFT_2829 [Rhizomucor pusillus]|uniref:uncharacterized protein n=1 Tax=Rhizomucor pusillus TaxID=4840 RepID=UPI003743BAE6